MDFRQLIKDFAEEFRIRIEMKQIGARQEAGLIGGLGVCGQALCCSRYMNNFQSITTQAARCQDLSLNPQKLAGQCGKLKCCINYEASVYVDAQSKMPRVTEPLQFDDGEAYLMKTDILKGMMWFSYDPKSMSNMVALDNQEVKEIIAMNRKGIKAPSCMQNSYADKSPEFMSAAGEESISRFDNDKKKKKNRRNKGAEHAAAKSDEQKPQEQAKEVMEKENAPEKQGEKHRRGDRNRKGHPNREAREPKEQKEPRESREPRENRGPKENRGPRGNRGKREPQAKRQESGNEN